MGQFLSSERRLMAGCFEQKISKAEVPTLQSSEYFGVSVSLDGDRLAVGASYDDGWGTDGTDGDETGAVYVFKRTGNTWALEQEISDKSSGFTALNETTISEGVFR